MRLDFCAKLLEVLDDGAIDRATEVGVLICDHPSFVANVVVDVLERGLG